MLKNIDGCFTFSMAPLFCCWMGKKCPIQIKGENYPTSPTGFGSVRQWNKDEFGMLRICFQIFLVTVRICLKGFPATFHGSFSWLFFQTFNVFQYNLGWFSTHVWPCWWMHIISYIYIHILYVWEQHVEVYESFATKSGSRFEFNSFNICILWFLCFSPSLVPIPGGMRGRITSAPLFEMTGFGTPKSSFKGSPSTMMREEYLNKTIKRTHQHQAQFKLIVAPKIWEKHVSSIPILECFFSATWATKAHQLLCMKSCLGLF